jgi:hypothetical protein
LISLSSISQNINSEVVEILNNDNQSKGEEFVTGVIYNRAYVIENNYYYEYTIVDCEYQKKASKNPKFLETVSTASLYNLNENSELRGNYKIIGRNNYDIVLKYSCENGSNEFMLSYKFTNGAFTPNFDIEDLILSNIQNVQFILNDDFIQITSDYWDRELYKDDFLELVDQTDVLSLKLKEIEMITNDLFTNKDILFYVKNDVSAIITIEKSGLSFESAAQYKEELCSQQQKMFQDFGKILYFNCGIEEINGYDYFMSEVKTEIELDINSTPYEWSNQYWTDINGEVYHITINSTSGLKIQDVLVEII